MFRKNNSVSDTECTSDLSTISSSSSSSSSESQDGDEQWLLAEEGKQGEEVTYAVSPISDNVGTDTTAIKPQHNASSKKDGSLQQRNGGGGNGGGLNHNPKPLPTARGQIAKLCFGSAGIYACYLWYGHLQEDVFRYQSPVDGTKFHMVWFLQFLECICNIGVGVLGRMVFGGRQGLSYTPFFQSGASQVFSKALTSLSLAAGVSFPVCILAKSAKMVPVMLGQLVLGGSKYTARDYVFAGAVVIGTTMLSMGKSKDASGPQSSSSVTGLTFIILSLVMDGVTGGLQKKLKKEMQEQPPTTYDFLLFTNVSMGCIALFIALALGEISSGVYFLIQNPVLQQMIFRVCILSAMGQSFIFYVVAHFDPMVCATVTTTRKILSVLWSIAVKGHVVSSQGYLGLVLAICGVLFGLKEKIAKKMKNRMQQQQKQQQQHHHHQQQQQQVQQQQPQQKQKKQQQEL